MYCKHCGKKIDKESKFCIFCGKIVVIQHSTKKLDTGDDDGINESILNKDVHPYVISTTKVVLLTLTTFGIYQIYWFYKHFKSFKEEDDRFRITPWLSALFCTLTSYYLFKHLTKKVERIDKSMTINAGGLATLVFIFNAMSRLPDNYWWLWILSVIPLIPAQNAINYYWNKKYGDKIEEEEMGVLSVVIIIVGSVFIALAIYGSFLP